jgi:hypothetical protein
MDGRRNIDHLLNSIEDDSIHHGKGDLLDLTASHGESLPRGSVKQLQFKTPIILGHSHEPKMVRRVKFHS